MTVATTLCLRRTARPPRSAQGVFRGSSVDKAKVNGLLAAKPSGWMVSGEPLPDPSGHEVGPHTKRNAQGVEAERPARRCSETVMRVGKAGLNTLAFRRIHADPVAQRALDSPAPKLP